MDSSKRVDTSDALSEQKLPRYEQLPTFGLYVDQLVSFVNDTVDFSYMPDEKALTASMVNNYVKQGIVPKPENKRYSRNHIAYLIVVCILKKVFSIQEITELIQIQINAYPTYRAYDSFVASLEQSLAEVFTCDVTKSGLSAQGADVQLVTHAVTSFSSKLYVQIKIDNKAQVNTKSKKSTNRGA